MNNKLPFISDTYKDRLILENITTGECDFCEASACHARRVDLDVFLFCEHHKRLLEPKIILIPKEKFAQNSLQITALGEYKAA